MFWDPGELDMAWHSSFNDEVVEQKEQVGKQFLVVNQVVRSLSLPPPLPPPP